MESNDKQFSRVYTISKDIRRAIKEIVKIRKADIDNGELSVRNNPKNKKRIRHLCETEIPQIKDSILKNHAKKINLEKSQGDIKTIQELRPTNKEISKDIDLICEYYSVESYIIYNGPLMFSRNNFTNMINRELLDNMNISLMTGKKTESAKINTLSELFLKLQKIFVLCWHFNIKVTEIQNIYIFANFMETIEKFNTSKLKITSPTVADYSTSLRKYFKNMNIINDIFLEIDPKYSFVFGTFPDIYIDHYKIKSMSKNNDCKYANKNINKYINDDLPLLNKIIKGYDLSFAKLNKKTEKDKSNWVIWDKILCVSVLFDKMLNDEKFNKNQDIYEQILLLNTTWSFYTKFYVRRGLDYNKMIYIDNKKDHDEAMESGHHNYYYYDKKTKQGKFHFLEHKTSKDMKALEDFIVPTKLNELLQLFVKTFDVESKDLLLRNTLNKYSSIEDREKITKIIFKYLSELQNEEFIFTNTEIKSITKPKIWFDDIKSRQIKETINTVANDSDDSDSSNDSIETKTKTPKKKSKGYSNYNESQSKQYIEDETKAKNCKNNLTQCLQDISTIFFGKQLSVQMLRKSIITYALDNKLLKTTHDKSCLALAMGHSSSIQATYQRYDEEKEKEEDEEENKETDLLEECEEFIKKYKHDKSKTKDLFIRKFALKLMKKNRDAKLNIKDPNDETKRKRGIRDDRKKSIRLANKEHISEINEMFETVYTAVFYYPI